MAAESEDIPITPSMNRILQKRPLLLSDHSPDAKPGVAPPVPVVASQAPAPSPGVAASAPAPLPPAPPRSRTPTVRLDDAAPAAVLTKETALPEPAPALAKTPPHGLRKTTVTMPDDAARITGNERRTPLAMKLFIATLAIMLVAFGAAALLLQAFYEGNIEPRFATVGLPAVIPTTPPAPDLTPQLQALQKELASTQEALRTANSYLERLQREQSKLAGLQQGTEGHLAKLEAQQQGAEDKLAKLTAVVKQVDDRAAAAKPGDNSASLSAALQVASVVPVRSAANEELWLMKERNRLTLYADRAIAQGSSEAMRSLWQSLTDPDLERLRDSVQVEIIRVQNYYARLSRLPPDYRLPVAELFHDEAIRSEENLQPKQVIPLLLDPKQPLEVRIRSAVVLSGRRTDEVAEALVQAIKNDPMLDVVKEAQRTLEMDFGLSVPLLHVKAAADWWEHRTAKPAK